MGDNLGEQEVACYLQTIKHKRILTLNQINLSHVYLIPILLLVGASGVKILVVFDFVQVRLLWILECEGWCGCVTGHDNDFVLSGWSGSSLILNLGLAN